MRPTLVFLSLFVLAAVLTTPAAFAFADDDEGDRVIYANSPKDRYEAKIEMLENRAAARKAQCRGSGVGGRSFCTQEIEKELREKKREAKVKYEAEIAAPDKSE
ncbi:MAG: hypothetical protein IT493_02085 [Gammaproteobacteria bacterium]|nr:hypothetical protein [Gammaproteobacteria bacterium]